jgi:hypothetical protein
LASTLTRAERAQELRGEAHALLSQSGLFELLQARFGDPTVTGSASYDLMVWRNIDIHVAIEAPRLNEWIGFAADLSAHLDTVGLSLPRATFANDYVSPGPQGQGLYWGLHIKDFSGNPWLINLWGWDPFDYAVRQARDFAFRTDLAGADRELILRLKTLARERANYYGVIVSAWDIYQFAIDKGGETLEALERWKARG